MSKMKKIVIVIIPFMILSLFISGCLDDNKTNGNLNEIYVSKNSGADFSNIKDAIENIADGGTIYLDEGIYYESITITKSINLIGDDNGETVIVQTLSDGLDSVVRVVSDNCVIKGLNILCHKISSDIEVIGLNVSSSNNIISNNIINSSGKGIFLDKFSKNNDISNNTIFNSSYGIYAFNSDINNFLKNNISSCLVYGIYMLNSDNNSISNNIIFNNEYGMRIKGSNNNIVFNNTVIKNMYGVLCCCEAENNVIYNNIFKENHFWNAADEGINNQWDYGTIGNFWDDYVENYPNAKQVGDIWDTPYELICDDETRCGDIIDSYPFVNPPDV